MIFLNHLISFFFLSWDTYLHDWEKIRWATNLKEFHCDYHSDTHLRTKTSESSPYGYCAFFFFFICKFCLLKQAQMGVWEMEDKDGKSNLGLGTIL